MKKTILILLTLICCLCIFTACHECEWATEWTTDATHHWHECIGDDCNEIGDKAEHVYDQQVAETQYLKSSATCTEKAVYYLSCICGAKGVETFENGSVAAHTQVIDSAVTATCTTAGKTEGKHCSVCNQVLVAQTEIPALGHEYSTEWSNNQTHHWHASICGHEVTSDSAEHTFDNGFYCVVCNYIDVDVVADSIDSFKSALASAQNGDVIAIAKGVYDFQNETINIDKAVVVVGLGNLDSQLSNVIFDVDSSSDEREMNATFYNLKFTGASRIVVGNRTHHNGVGGPDVLPVTSLTIQNCYAKSEFATDSMTAGKGQFVYLAAVYTVKIDLVLQGNTIINAHTIDGEDASPVVNGNGTIINSVYIADNTFGDSENPCDRYAVKFARRANGATIVIKNNVVYGATTAEKDFYILDLWQSGSNVQNDLTVSISGNTVNCTPDTDRTVYLAYIEKTVTGTNIVVTADGDVLDLSVEQ